MFIYKITNRVNSKCYIGQTIQNPPIKRWNTHSNKKKASKKNSVLSNAILKYGKENFTFEVIDKAVSIDELNEKETYWIEYYNSLCPNGYNVSLGGLNKMHTEESKKKISMSKLGEKNPNWKGKSVTDEVRKKMSENTKGERNPFYGKIHKPETIKKILEKRDDQSYRTDEYRKKQSESHKGKIVSLETKEKMRQYRLGRKRSEEDKQKMREGWARKKLERVVNIEC